MSNLEGSAAQKVRRSTKTHEAELVYPVVSVVSCDFVDRTSNPQEKHCRKFISPARAKQWRPQPPRSRQPPGARVLVPQFAAKLRRCATASELDRLLRRASHARALSTQPR